MKTKNTRASARRLRVMFCCISLQLLGAGVARVDAQDSEPADVAPPNFVVIMTDDQTVETMRVMPKTRALIARMGTTFSNSFVSFPLCCPSRATFLTGQYPHNHGVLHSIPPTGGYSQLNHYNTLPVWLEDAGYYTAHIGKYLNGYGKEDATEIPPGWTDWQGLIDGSTYRMYDYKINDNGEVIRYADAEEDYQTDVLADRAVLTLAKAARRQPFFLSVATLAPHGEVTVRLEGPPNPRPAPRHAGEFEHESLPWVISFNESDVSDKPSFIRKLPRITGLKGVTAHYRARLGSLMAVDDLVGRVVNKLTNTGALDNTVLIFTSDNGFLLGEHRIKHGKLTMYEEAVRVPLFIRGKGFSKGRIASQYVSNVDLAPTIARLAEANIRRVMDGVSLRPLARDPQHDEPRDLLIEGLQRGGAEDRNYQALRNKAFLYVEYPNEEQELYDMRHFSPNYDPYQLESRHDDSDYLSYPGRLYLCKSSSVILGA
ncbi:MAG: sulfatase family protein [Gammaproteobacteria bacterium]